MSTSSSTETSAYTAVDARRHEEMMQNLRKRRHKGTIWQALFYLATTIAIVALITLLLNIFNRAFGFVLIHNEIQPEELVASGDLADLSEGELITILEDNLSSGLIRRFNYEEPLADRSLGDLVDLVQRRIVNPTIVESFTLGESLFRQNMIRRSQTDAQVELGEPVDLRFRSWLTPRFIAAPQNPKPQLAGVRTALLGSVWMIAITALFAFPIGVAAAIYLEEYAKRNRLNRIIQVNIYNLSGVPSIIYGLLGLAVFVRALGAITSGLAFGGGGDATENGRTIISAGLTLGLLILPIIIINSQEAIRAVSQSLRDSSYALGATRWETIRHHVLPASFDRILTGTILAISRAVGETAPLVVIGASTFISVDPTSIFSKFTALPIQIYQWSARPQGQFRNVAAAAIIVLLVLMLSMNAAAIIMRNRISKQRRA
ncbi:MAG: phosphate ABC transporter permease PstA [Spirochaetota bacterium]